MNISTEPYSLWQAHFLAFQSHLFNRGFLLSRFSFPNEYSKLILLLLLYLSFNSFNRFTVYSLYFDVVNNPLNIPI